MNKLELLVQANSPFNDGYTQEFYREQLKKKTMNNYTEFVKQTTSAPRIQ